MDNSSGNITKFRIYTRVVMDSGSTLTGTMSGFSFVNADTTPPSLQAMPPKDFYIPVCLSRSVSLTDYVQVDKDNTIFTMERQDINPYFIEFGFFDTIQRNQVNVGQELTIIQINYLRSVYGNISSFTDSEIRDWFNNTGRYIPNFDFVTLETISLLASDIVSKAHYFGIDINS